MGILGEKKARNTEHQIGASNLNIDGLNADVYKMYKQRLHINVGTIYYKC